MNSFGSHIFNQLFVGRMPAMRDKQTTVANKFMSASHQVNELTHKRDSGE